MDRPQEETDSEGVDDTQVSVASDPEKDEAKTTVETPEDNEIKLDNVADLQGRSVVAFQNAKKFITGDYKSMVPNIIDYRELPEQDKQVQMLFTGRTEVIVLDVNIFKYAVRTSDNPAFKKKYKIHHIFDLRHYAAGFKNKTLKEKFDRGIQLIKDNGTYQNILDKYLNN